MGRKLIPDTTPKRCARCGEEKPRTEFKVNEYRNGRTYRRSYCRECAKLERSDWYHKKGGADYYKQYRKAKPSVSAKASRRLRLKKAYGLTEADYARMFEAQGGKCALCGDPPSKKALAVDHDHTTNRNRDLLCHKCNPALGSLNDDPALLRKAADYIEYHRSKL